MVRRSRTRDREEHVDRSPNHQEAEAQPTEINAEKPRLLSPEPDSTPPKDPEIKKKKKKKKVKKSEGAETNEPNQIRAEPDSTHPENTKRKRVPKREGAEINVVDSEHRELCPKSDPLPPKDSDPFVLPEPEAVADKNETNPLCSRPESTPSRKMKRNSVSRREGAETNGVNSEHCEVCPNLDPLPHSDNLQLPEPKPVAEKNKANQLCTEPDSKPPRKRKRKSVSLGEGTEKNDVDSERNELCPKLDLLSPKDSDPVLLLEPERGAERNETNQLCPKQDSTPRKKRKSVSKIEGAEINDVDSENLKLCAKLDPLPPKDSEPLLLPEPEPAPLKEAERKKNKRKKKKKKGELGGEGVESNRPNDEHCQQCHKAKPTTPEEPNQRKKKRRVMEETHNLDLRPRTGASILHSKEVGLCVQKQPSKRYEHYERCLECGQICHKDKKCGEVIHVYRNLDICFFCGEVGHTLGKCPMSPGAKYANGIIMLDAYVRRNCRKIYEGIQPKSQGIQPRSYGIQPPKSQGIQPRSYGIQQQSEGIQPPKSQGIQPPKSQGTQPQSEGIQQKSKGNKRKSKRNQRKSEVIQPKVVPANMPNMPIYGPIYTWDQRGNIQPYFGPVVRPIFAPFSVWRT